MRQHAFLNMNRVPMKQPSRCARRRRSRRKSSTSSRQCSMPRTMNFPCPHFFYGWGETELVMPPKYLLHLYGNCSGQGSCRHPPRNTFVRKPWASSTYNTGQTENETKLHRQVVRADALARNRNEGDHSCYSSWHARQKGSTTVPSAKRTRRSALDEPEGHPKRACQGLAGSCASLCCCAMLCTCKHRGPKKRSCKTHSSCEDWSPDPLRALEGHVNLIKPARCTLASSLPPSAYLTHLFLWMAPLSHHIRSISPLWRTQADIIHSQHSFSLTSVIKHAPTHLRTTRACKQKSA